MKRSRQGKKSQKKSQTKSQKTKSRTRSVNSRRSGQASRTHSTWGFAWISERHAATHAGRAITRAVANVGRPTPTFATGVAPAATGCPCRTTGPCSSGRERSAASARRRASRSASIIATPPARCGACCAATAISASATTRTIPFLPGRRRHIWKRRGVMTGIGRAPTARRSIRSHDLVFSRSRRRTRAKAPKAAIQRLFSWIWNFKFTALGAAGGNLKGICRKIQGRPHVPFKPAARTAAKQRAMGRGAHRRAGGGWSHWPSAEGARYRRTAACHSGRSLASRTRSKRRSQ